MPLLNDFDFLNAESDRQCKHPFPSFIYVGSHSVQRQLETVLKGIVYAVEIGAKGQFVFVGASTQEEMRLSSLKGVGNLKSEGVIVFERPVAREMIPVKLFKADVGLSIIPPVPIYQEASPTKLAEYMGAGLAVIASRGISMQDKFVSESEGGLLVDWNVKSIADGILTLCTDSERLVAMQYNAMSYAENYLKYEYYLSEFLEILGIIESE